MSENMFQATNATLKKILNDMHQELLQNVPEFKDLSFEEFLTAVILSFSTAINHQIHVLSQLGLLGEFEKRFAEDPAGMITMRIFNKVYDELRKKSQNEIG